MTRNRPPRPTLAMILLGLSIDLLDILLAMSNAILDRMERWQASARTTLDNLQNNRRL